MQRKNLKSVGPVSNINHNSNSRRYTAIAQALAAGIGMVGMAAAAHADSAWTGTVGNYQDTTWSAGNPTTGAQNADVDNGGTVTISSASGTVNVNDIRAGDGTAPTAVPSSGTWIQTGDTATVNGWFRMATNSSTSVGNYNLSGGTLITKLYSNVGEAGTAVFTMSGTGVWNDTATGDQPIAFGGSGSGGGSGKGTLNMSGGTINTGVSEFWIGNGSATSTGIVNMTGGTLTVGSWLSIGRAGGSGTLNLSGGVINKTTTSGHISLTGIGGTGVINQTGGTLTSSTDFWLTENGPGTWNLSGGVATITGGINVDNGGATGAIGILNMTGGTLTANSFFKGGASGTGTVNFNGGQFISGASSTTFMTGLTAANILTGGLNFNTSTFSDTIAQPLLGSATDGGLNLTGTGTLTLSGANTFQGPIVINSAALNYARTDTYTQAQVISGTGNLIMSGSGTMTLTGSNTYGGTTTVTNGVLYAPTEANIPNYLTKLTASTTGELALGVQVGGTGPGFTLADINTLLTNGTFVTGGTTTTSPTLGLDTTNGNYTFATNIVGGIGFDKRGANTLTLTGTNNFTGRLTVTAGTLDIGSNTTQTGTTTIGDPGILVNGSGSGTGTLLQEGGSISSGSQETWVGNGSGSTGIYNISGGTLTSGFWMAIGRGAGAVGTVNLSGTGVINKGSSIAAPGNLTLGSITGTGTINQTGGTLNNLGTNTYVGETGNGTYNMSGGVANLGPVYVDYNLSSTTTGTLNLNAGVLSASLVARNSSTGTAVLNFNGGTLQANASSTTFVNAINGTFTTNVLAGGAIINTNGFNDTITTALIGSTGDGGLTKLGAGALTLSGTNTYNGNTTVSAGSLIIGSTASLATAGSLNNSGIVNFNGKFAQAAGSSTPGITLAGNLNASSASNFIFSIGTTGADYVNFGGAATVNSGASITVTTPAAQTLTPGTYNLFTDATGNLASFVLTNNFVVTGGTYYPLTLNATSGADVLTVGTGQAARLFFTGNTSNDTSVAGNFSTDAAGSNVSSAAPSAFTDVVFTATTGNAANFTTTLGSLTAVNSLEFSNANSTPVNVGGPGTLTISANANTFTAGTGIVVDSGAPADTLSANISLPMSETIANNSGSLFTISGAIGSTSTGTVVTFNGSGSAVLLSGTNTYTGGTVISSGTVKLGSSNALGTSTNTLTLSGTGIVDLNGSTVSQGSLNLAGGTMTDSSTGLTGVLTLNGTTASGPTILISTIVGTGYVNSPVASPIATGAIALTGAANSIVKPIAAGNPVIASNLKLGGVTTVSLSDTSGDAAGELSLTGVISGSGTLTLDNSAVVPGVTMGNTYDWGTLTLTGSNTYSGGTNINWGRVVVANSMALGTGPVTIAQRTVANGGSGGTLQLGNRAYTSTSAPLAVAVIATGINIPNAISFGGAISGDYAEGIWNDSGANTLSGNITLTNAVENVQVASGSLLMSGNISESFTGATLVKNNAGGPLTLSGSNNTFTGGAIINAGELIAASNHAIGTGAVLVVSGADANIASGTQPNAFTVNGSGVALGGALTGSATSAAASGIVSGPVNLGTIGTNARVGALAADFLTVTGPITNGTAGVNLDISGLGTGSANSSGFGTVILEGVNTYTGATTVIRGNLTVDGSKLLPGQSNINTTGVINIGSSASVGDQGTFTLQNGGVVTTTNTFYSSNSNSNTTVNINGGVLTANTFQLGNEALGSGITSTDSLTQTGGTINTTQYFSIGFSGAGTATANLSGGTINIHTNGATTGDFEVGVFDTQVATINIGTGEAINIDNSGNMPLGSQNNSANNTVNQNGGTVTFYSDTGTTVGGTGTLSLGRISGGYNSSGTETYNLNGGTLTVPSITRTTTSTATTSAGIFNFNGGTLVAAASSATFMQGLTAVKLQSGGGTIDSNGKTITIAQVITDGTTAGVLNIQDSAAVHGSITLTGSSTFSGGVNLNSGELLVSNATAGVSPTGSGLVTLNGGILGSGPVGTVNGFVQAGTGNHTIAPGGPGAIGNLILAGGLITNNTPANGGITTVNFDLGPGVTSTTVGSFHVITDGDLLTFGAGSTVYVDPGTPVTIGSSLSGSPAPTGLYRLMTDQDGTIIPNLAGQFSLATAAPTGDTTWALDYTDDPGYIDLDVVSAVVAAQNLSWNNTGAASPTDGLTWDTTNNNWNNGAAATTFSNSRMDNVTFNDTNNVHYNVSIPGTVTPGSTTFNNSTGNYNVSGAGGIGGTGALVKLGTGTVTLASTNTYTGGTNVSNGTLILSGKGAFPAATSLTIGASGTVQIAAHTGGASNVVVVATSSLSNSGELDVTNNDLLVRGGSFSAINTEVKAGYNNGWNASVGSIYSTTAAANPSHLTAVGVVLNDNPNHPGTALFSSFDGASTVDGDVLVKYTYYGDANLDGAVDGSDYTLIDNGFSNHLSGWYNGDFNYDGKIDGSDYTLIDNAFNTQGATLGTNPAALIASPTAQFGGSSSSSVPEPTTLGMLGLGAVGLLSKRRRRGH